MTAALTGRRPVPDPDRLAYLHSTSAQVHLAVSYADRIIALRAGLVVADAPAGRLDERALEQIYARAAPAGAGP